LCCGVLGLNPKMKRANNLQRALFIMLILSTLALVVSFFLNDSLIVSNVLVFSKDKLIAPGTATRVKTRIQCLAALSLMSVSFLILLLRHDTAKMKKRIHAALHTIKWQGMISLAKSNKVMYILLALLLLYFGTICFFMIRGNDIGTDEGYYLGAVKSFYENGRFNLPTYEYAEFRSQMIYYPFYLIRLIAPFSNYNLRILVCIYAMLLLLVLCIYVSKRYAFVGSLLLLVLLVSEKAFVFAASSGFGELPAFLFLVLGFMLWTSRPNRQINRVLAACTFALAVLTKFQIALILSVLLFLFIIFSDYTRRSNVALLLYTIMFSLFGAVIFVLAQGYGLAEASVSLWNIFSRSSEVAFTLPVLARLSHINSFFNANNVIICSFVIVYYAIRFGKITFFEKVLFVFGVLNSVWWIFSYFDMHIRNLIYAIVINDILFAIAVSRFLGKPNRRIKILLIGSMVLFCLFRFVDTSVFSIRGAHKGIHDEIDYAIVGYETYSKDEFRSAQAEFYRVIDKEIAPDKTIYHIGVGFDKYVHTKRELKSVKRATKAFRLFE
jgi:hypothetical protein